MQRARSTVSRASRSSNKSRSSAKSRANSFFGSYKAEEEDEVREEHNPFDQVFGKKICDFMKSNKLYIEKMQLHDFKTIDWDFKFPNFIVDIFRYIAGFNIDEYVKIKNEELRQQKEK